MKRLLFVVIVLLTFAVVNTSASIFGQMFDHLMTKEQTVVEKVGLNLLAEKEAILIAAVKEIDLFILQIGSDGVVERKESIELLKSVRKFKRLKKKVDGSLKFYELTTKTDLAEGLKTGLFGDEATWGLFSYPMRIRDKHDKLKHYLVTQVKKDVIIKSFLMFTFIFFVLMIFGITLICLGLFITGEANSTTVLCLLVGMFCIALIFI